MRVKSLHTSFIMPTKGSDQAGAHDIYMIQAGSTTSLAITTIGLGFSAEVPEGHVALIMPRSSIGAQYGLELNNTCGVIDSDYRGEWKVALRTKSGTPFNWQAGQRLLQFLIVPITNVTLELVDELSDTNRGAGGFGSSGK